MKPKIESLYKKFPRIHILVNNAGITYRGKVNTWMTLDKLPISHLMSEFCSVLNKACISSDETFRKIMDVNFFGLFRLTNLILNNMIEENKKSNSKRSIYSIVNIGSVQSYIGIPYRSACKIDKETILYINFIKFWNELKNKKHLRLCFQACFIGIFGRSKSRVVLSSKHRRNQCAARIHKYKHIYKCFVEWW